MAGVYHFITHFHRAIPFTCYYRFLFIIYNWLHPNRTEGVVIAGMIIKLSGNYDILTSIVLRGPVFFFPPNVFMNLAESVRPFGSLLVLLLIVS